MFNALLRCLVLAWACAAQAHGPVIAIGGALKDDNTAVWSQVVQLAGGAGSRFVVVATASAEPERAAAQIGANLQRHGAHATHLHGSLDTAAAVALIAQADGVFFSGGEQARLLDAWQPGKRDGPLLTAVRALLARGGVVAGTSAGAAVLSRTVFRDAPDVFAAMQSPLRDGIEVDTGFGIVAPDIVVDQHFLKRGRIGRLLPLLLRNGVPFGLGVEEDSAAVIRGHEVRAIGTRGVLIVDTAAATTDAALGVFNVAGVRLSYLAAGDRADLRRRTIEPAAGKAVLPLADAVAARAPALLADILGDGVVLTAMSRLVRGDAALVAGLALPAAAGADGALGFEWLLSRGPATRGWAGRGSVDDTLAGIVLTVQPVRVAQPLYAPWRPARPPS